MGMSLGLLNARLQVHPTWTVADAAAPSKTKNGSRAVAHGTYNQRPHMALQKEHLPSEFNRCFEELVIPPAALRKK